MNCNVSVQDIKLFYYLHAVKIALIEQIKRDVYAHLRKKTLYTKLRRLEKRGFLKSTTVTEKRKKVYFLSKEGFSQIEEKESQKRKELKSDSIAHDLGLVDIRHAFKSCPRVLKYLTENEAQTWKQDSLMSPFLEVHSDAVIKVSFPKGNFYLGIEYECSYRSKNRLQRALKRYYSKPEILAVLYILLSKRRRNSLMGEEKRLFSDSPSKIFYSLLEDLMAKNLISLVNSRGEKLQFEKAKNSLLKNKKGSKNK